MATPKYFDPADIETQARYRPGVASNIFNVLTGGLAGQISGSTQRAQEAARARQALLQEEFGKRDEERAIKRQLFVNAIQQGAELDPNATIAQMADDLRKQKIKRDLLQQSGRISAYNEAAGQTPQGVALLADRTSPFFQAAQLAAKADLGEKEAQVALEEKRQTPALRAQLEGLAPGTYIPPNAPAGQLRGLIQAAQYKLPMQMRQQSDVDALTDMYASNPDLKAFKGYTTETIGNVAPVLAKTMMALGKKELEQTADAKNKELAASATKEFSSILQLAPDERTKPENVARLNELARYVPPVYTQNSKFLSAVGLGQPLEDKQLAEIKDYDDSLRGINRFVTVLGEVAKTPGSIKKFQESNFGTISNELRNQSSKFFANDAERELARSLVQEYEGFVAGRRKTLFGQSLVAREEQSSNINFGKPSDKDFFNRALQFIDRTVESDPVTFYLNAGKGVPEGTIKSVTDKKRRFDEFKSNQDIAQLLGVFGRGQQAPQAEQSLLSPEKQALKRKLEAKKMGMYERYF
jgi:hypothetical protein